MKESLYRAHSVSKAPWWFSSNSSGRFDLISPNGTFYAAKDLETSLRERFGHELVNQGFVTFEAAAGTRVSILRVPAPRWLANTCSAKAAAFGTTREIATCSTYPIPQSWAASFFGTGKHHGIRYATRFSTGPGPNAVALFDVAGEHKWATGSFLGGVDACKKAGIQVVHPPNRRDVQIVQPPD